MHTDGARLDLKRIAERSYDVTALYVVMVQRNLLRLIDQCLGRGPNGHAGDREVRYFNRLTDNDQSQIKEIQLSYPTEYRLMWSV